MIDAKEAAELTYTSYKGFWNMLDKTIRKRAEEGYSNANFALSSGFKQPSKQEVEEKLQKLGYKVAIRACHCKEFTGCLYIIEW